MPKSGYNAFSALNLAKQDRNVRNAIRNGEAYKSKAANYPTVLSYVQNKVSETDSYRRVLSQIMEEGDESKAKDQLMGIIYTLLSKYDGATMDNRTIDEFQTRIYQDMTGFGILTEFLDDPEVEEINIFGPGNRQIEIVPSGKRAYMLEEGFPNAQAVIDIVKRMVRVGNMVIDQQDPRVDSYMEGGTRISAMIAPIIREDKGAVASIRKQTKARISLDDYLNSKTGMEEEFEFLELCLRNGVSGATVGATGSGKTTLLNFLVSDYCNYAGEAARVYIIEESREMQLPPDSKTIYTAVTGTDGTKGVSAPDLLKSALRFHPTFICAAEMRGEEAMNAMMAAQTGHIVWSTFHADSGEDAYDRLLTMCKLSGTDLSENLLMRNLVSAFPIIVSTQQLKDGKRKITGIYEATGVEGSNVVGHYIYKMQVSRYIYAEDGIRVKRVKGYHMRVGDLSDKLAQRIFNNCGQRELVKKFAAPDWEPILPDIERDIDEHRAYEEF